MPDDVKDMRVALDLSTAKVGGGRTYLNEFVPQFAQIAGNAITLALAPRGAGEHLLPYGVERVFETDSRFGFLDPNWLRTVGRHADVLFAPTEIGWAPPGVPLVLSVRNPNLDAANTVHRSPRARLRYGTQRSAARLSLSRANRVIAVSHYAAAIASKCLKVNPLRLRVIYHGAPRNSLPPSRPRGEATRFLLVSNLNEYKGVESLIQGLANVGGSWTFCIVGKQIRQDYMSHLDHLALALGIRSRIHFLGALYGSDLLQAYADCDCLVWPSGVETFGHPLVEAAVYGIPIIAVDAASNREVAGPAAYYYEPGDISGLTRLLQQGQAGELVAGGLPRTYDWSACAQETSSVLRQAALHQA